VVASVGTPKSSRFGQPDDINNRLGQTAQAGELEWLMVD
jgi:hypothetical protein